MSNTLQPPSKVTVVEEGTEFQGTLTSSCPIDVRGRVEGELRTPALTVSASGAVHGRAKVGEVRSQGEISGEFDAEKIELAGVVRDKTIIRARSLDVKIGAQRGKLEIVFGECELSVGEEPTEHDYANEHAPAPVVAVVEALPLASASVEAVVSAVEAAVPVAEAAPAVAPDATASHEAPLVAVVTPGAPAVEALAEEPEEESDDLADATAPGAAGGKRKRRRKNGHDEVSAGWSQPPSQPPPAN